MSMVVLEALTRIAEIERKLDNLFRHGPVTERKQIDGRWLVRMRLGGSEDEPFLSPWIPYVSPNGGPEGLNVHRVPKEGEQLTLLSPAGDFQQGVATSLFWSDQHPPPSDDADAVVITHPKFKMTLRGGNLTIENAEEIHLKAGRSELEIKKDAINIVSDKIITVGKTYLGQERKDATDGDLVDTEAGPAKNTWALPG
ncbi:phage baseplate assembly protein V [Bradyrhizobium sp. HKCCYLRH3095]|uniref:phage baseplate assembly protein V n=1 Tax=Bradyrhizobium sp. HKCCYLRH3095 TaxID=3420765 RepID=UPI003EC138BD